MGTRPDVASRRSAPSGHVATTTLQRGPFSRCQKVPFLLAISSVGGMGGEYDIDAEGVDGGGPDPIGDGVVADGAGAVDAASPAGVCGVKAFGDLLGEGPAGGVVADLGGDLARHRPHRRHLDPARCGARRGRFITPRL